MDIHRALTASKDTERASYSEITIRELLRWTSHLVARANVSRSALAGDSLSSILSFEAWCVYGSRFRGVGRAIVRDCIMKAFQSEPQIAVTEGGFRVDEKASCALFDDISVARHSLLTSLSAIEQFDHPYATTAVKAHDAVASLLGSWDFVSEFGVYSISDGWLERWIRDASTGNQSMRSSPNPFGAFGASMYMSRVRGAKARALISAVFQKTFDLGTQPPLLRDHQLAVPERPYVPTARVLEVWKQLARSMRVPEPVLVVLCFFSS
jgi:hypothetical protein